VCSEWKLLSEARPDALFIKSIPVILSLVQYLLGGKYFLRDAIMGTLRVRE
jgi:hypothetical protein